MLIEECLNCGTLFEVDKIHKDELGCHVVCPECNSSMDIEFEFECNMSDEYKNYDSIDDFGSAFAWYGNNIGAEYNYCIDNGNNYCAIYKLKFNNKTGKMETVSDVFEHYEIDFSDVEWKNKLKNVMFEVLEKFIE